MFNKRASKDDSERAHPERKIIRRTAPSVESRYSRNKHSSSKMKTTIDTSQEKYTKIVPVNITSRTAITPRHPSEIYAMDNTLRRRREVGRSFLKPSTHDKEIESYYGPFAVGAMTQMPAQSLKCRLLEYLKEQRIDVTEVEPWKFECRVAFKTIKVVINQLNSIEGVHILRFIGDCSQFLLKEILSRVIE